MGKLPPFSCVFQFEIKPQICQSLPIHCWYPPPLQHTGFSSYRKKIFWLPYALTFKLATEMQSAWCHMPASVTAKNIQFLNSSWLYTNHRNWGWLFSKGSCWENHMNELNQTAGCCHLNWRWCRMGEKNPGMYKRTMPRFRVLQSPWRYGEESFKLFYFNNSCLKQNWRNGGRQ